MRDTDGHRHCDRCGAILTRENNKCGYEICDKCNEYLDDLGKNKPQESEDTALEQEPKQVELEGDGYADGKLVYDYGKCPSCGWQFEYGEKDWEEPYCCHCGQKLKWFEESEE